MVYVKLSGIFNIGGGGGGLNISGGRDSAGVNEAGRCAVERCGVFHLDRSPRKSPGLLLKDVKDLGSKLP